MRHSMAEPTFFSTYLDVWDLVPDGRAIVTRGSRLLPVCRHGQPAMLKIAVEAEERAGAALMDWWAGVGAAQVLERDAHAILLERAVGPGCLAALARDRCDDKATRLICAAAARLHAKRPGPPPTLVPLTRWFRDLAPAAATYGGVLAESSAAARALLASPRP